MRNSPRNSPVPKNLPKNLSLMPPNGVEGDQARDDYFGCTSWLTPLITPKKEADDFSSYREFVYKSGGIEVEGKASISAELPKSHRNYHLIIGFQPFFNEFSFRF